VGSYDLYKWSCFTPTNGRKSIGNWDEITSNTKELRADPTYEKTAETFRELTVAEVRSSPEPPGEGY